MEPTLPWISRCASLQWVGTSGHTTNSPPTGSVFGSYAAMVTAMSAPIALPGQFAFGSNKERDLGLYAPTQN
jgi:hypothetical protein